MNFLDQLLEMTDESETPKSFIFWAGLTSISAVLKNNVYLDKFYYKLYPNIYVMLIAKSGMRKSFAVYIAKALVKAVNNTKVISGRNSIQAIIKELAHTQTSPDGGPPNTDATALIASGEFANLLVEDPQSLTILTDLYDGHYNPEWSNTLKGTGVEKLKNISLTLLGASNQTHFKDRISSVDITGGFIARTLIVVETKKHRINPLTEKPILEFDINPLSVRLKEIAGLRGQFKFSDDGKKEFESWYEEFSAKDSEDHTGTSERMHDHVLKIAMLLSISETNDLILRKQDIERAIDTCLSFATNVRRVTVGVGISELSSKISVFMQTLISSKGYELEHGLMLRKNYGNFDAFDLGKIVDTLSQAGMIKLRRYDRKVFYGLTDATIAEYFRNKKELE